MGPKPQTCWRAVRQNSMKSNPSAFANKDRCKEVPLTFLCPVVSPKKYYDFTNTSNLSTFHCSSAKGMIFSNKVYKIENNSGTPTRF